MSRVVSVVCKVANLTVGPAITKAGSKVFTNVRLGYASAVACAVPQQDE